MNEKDLDFGVLVFFSTIAFVLLLTSVPEESLKAITNAGQVMILLFNISLIYFSVMFGKFLLTVSLLISWLILSIGDIIIERCKKLDSVDKLIIIFSTFLILFSLCITYYEITSEPVELELKDDYKKQMEGLKYECDKLCYSKDKVVNHAGWDNWNGGFLCTCCDKIYTKDIWGNKYTGCETYNFNRKDWVQGIMAQKESLGESLKDCTIKLDESINSTKFVLNRYEKCIDYANEYRELTKKWEGLALECMSEFGNQTVDFTQVKFPDIPPRPTMNYTSLFKINQTHNYILIKNSPILLKRHIINYTNPIFEINQTKCVLSRINRNSTIIYYINCTNPTGINISNILKERVK